jgi:hypothetical protein
MIFQTIDSLLALHTGRLLRPRKFPVTCVSSWAELRTINRLQWLGQLKCFYLIGNETCCLNILRYRMLRSLNSKSKWGWQKKEKRRGRKDRLCSLVVRVPGCRSRSPGSDSRHYQIFWEVVGLERGPLILVSTIEELLERKSSGSGLDIWDHGRGDPSRWSRNTFYPQKLALTSPTSGGRSAGIVRLHTKGHGVCLFDCLKGKIWKASLRE